MVELERVERKRSGRCRALALIALLALAGLACGKVHNPSDADLAGDAAQGGTDGAGTSGADAGGSNGIAGASAGAGGRAGGDAGAPPTPTCPIVYQYDVAGGAYRIQAAFAGQFEGLATEAGVPLGGMHVFQVTYYNTETGQDFAYQQAQRLPVEKGCFDMAPFLTEPIGLFWIGIKLDSSELSPRIKYSNAPER